MRSRLVLGLAAVVLLLSSANAPPALGKKPMAAYQDLSQLTWTEQASGVTVALLWGDMDKGPYGALTRFKAGSWVERHVHPSDAQLVVIEGAYVHRPDDGPEVRVTPGSHLFLPGGTAHVSGSDVDTLFLHTSEGRFGLELRPKEGMAKPKDSGRR